MQFLALAPTPFTVFGAALARDAAITTLGADLNIANGWVYSGKFDGTLARDARVHAGSGTLRYVW
jgi:uncharacterized protein with beta-barrel porin domain